MLTIVLVLNALLTLICLLSAWQVWKLRRTLGKLADTLNNVERSTHGLLHGAPDAILKGQMGMVQLRERYAQLAPQLQQAQQALRVVGVGNRVLRSRTRKVRA
ncbi:hypothetical protein [Leptolyngbya sp. FACHB-261]|uniref:hypothetical protein n=1 Tax=Leptolyngbya sp. FACHB-261 TaxID=2692806 RepID=UPI0016877AD4|nr:hypothetical protein [Leptolyngbya sp. FACHB-261]MBD2102942.1 hypothetical protein [Leptolyngbya sp. FACHB-261]